jgi:hypothetical protein
MPSIHSSEIVLVGNARSLLERRGLGETIYAFSVVVRFNNFVTAGYEEHVGSKTDWWRGTKPTMSNRDRDRSRRSSSVYRGNRRKRIGPVRNDCCRNSIDSTP